MVPPMVFPSSLWWTGFLMFDGVMCPRRCDLVNTLLCLVFWCFGLLLVISCREDERGVAIVLLALCWYRWILR